MNCIEIRRLALISPRSLNAEQIAHWQSCAGCAEFAERMRTLEESLEAKLRIPVPEGLADRVLLNTRTRRSRRFSVWALAASLLFAVGIGISWLQVSEQPLAEEVIAHVLAEPETLNASQEVPSSELAAAFESYGGRLKGPIGKVSYLGYCKMPGGIGRHIVLDTPYGVATVIFAPPSNSTEARSELTQQGLSAVVIPVGRGHVGIVADSPQHADEVEKLITTQVSWRG